MSSLEGRLKGRLDGHRYMRYLALRHDIYYTLARRGIRAMTGYDAVQPLSGQRCITRAAFDAATPLARGWGVEVGMTIDVLRAGGRVLEVPCQLQHRVTGRDWASQVHRARQLADVSRALAERSGAKEAAQERAAVASTQARAGLGRAAAGARELGRRVRSGTWHDL